MTSASPPLLPQDFDKLDLHLINTKKIQTTPPKTPPNEPVSNHARIIQEGEFESEQHFYPRVLNAQIHPLVQSFFSLGNERIIARYTHLNPQVNSNDLKAILSYVPTHFKWAGKTIKDKKLSFF